MVIETLPGSRRRLLVHYSRFAVLSGMGWLLALLLLWAGVHAWALPVWAANAIGDAVAITFVFFASPQLVFGTHNSPKTHLFMLWCIWQIAHIALISFVLDFLVSATTQLLHHALGDALEVVLKIAITPVTLTLNFVVVRWLLHRRLP